MSKTEWNFTFCHIVHHFVYKSVRDVDTVDRFLHIILYAKTCNFRQPNVKNNYQHITGWPLMHGKWKILQFFFEKKKKEQDDVCRYVSKIGRVYEMGYLVFLKCRQTVR